MRKIITVTGEFNPEALGVCQCHEHLMLKKGTGWSLNPDLCMEDVEKSAEEVRRYRNAGGGTLVDAQPVGCCRMEKELYEVSRRTGVSVLAATGFHKRAFYPEGHWIFTESESRLQKIFEEELSEGMYEDCDRIFSGKRTEIRAGIVKVALEDRDSFWEAEGRFTAAVYAAIHGKKSLMVHTEPGSPVLEFLTFAEKLGMEMKRIAICHMDRTEPDAGIHREAASRGAYLEYDTIGRWKYHDNDTEALWVQRMLDGGYKDRLLFSLDTTAARMKAYRKDGIGLDFILKEFLPFLEKKKIGEDLLQIVLKNNSRNYLSM